MHTRKLEQPNGAGVRLDSLVANFRSRDWFSHSLGQKRLSRHVRIRSTFAAIADIIGDYRDFAFVP